MIVAKRYYKWIKTIRQYLSDRRYMMQVAVRPKNVIAKTVSIAFVFTTGCAAHYSASDIEPEKKGFPNQPLDVVVHNIHEQKVGEDRVGSNDQKTFQVYVTPLPDETGEKNDEGLITLKGDV